MHSGYRQSPTQLSAEALEHLSESREQCEQGEMVSQDDVKERWVSMTEIEWTPKALQLLEGLETESQERRSKRLTNRNEVM